MQTPVRDSVAHASFTWRKDMLGSASLKFRAIYSLLGLESKA